MTALGLPMVQCRTVLVTAVLQAGAVLPTMFPAPLDGILAARARRNHLGDSYHAEVVTPTRAALTADQHGTRDPVVAAYRARFRHFPLPLARICNPWVWAAGCAETPAAATTQLRHIHSRFRTAAAERIVPRLPANTDVGPTKPWRVPFVVAVTPSLMWRALGDPDGIRDLLSRVDAVGAHTSSGEGHVLRWIVDDIGPADQLMLLASSTGTISRPVPARNRNELGVPDAGTVAVDAYRPPYWRAPRHTDTGKTPSRTPREVIAPWTRMPRVCTPA